MLALEKNLLCTTTAFRQSSFRLHLLIDRLFLITSSRSRSPLKQYHAHAKIQNFEPRGIMCTQLELSQKVTNGRRMMSLLAFMFPDEVAVALDTEISPKCKSRDVAEGSSLSISALYKTQNYAKLHCKRKPAESRTEILRFANN